MHFLSFYSYDKILCRGVLLSCVCVSVYSNALQENLNSVLYNGFIEELVDVLGLQDTQLMEIRAASLRTLTSIIHLDRNPKYEPVVETVIKSQKTGFLCEVF